MISRDGARVSLWQDTVSPYVSSNIAQPGEVYDVAIIGGGITGVSTALLLQNAGKRCVLFEAHNLGYGTTGGTTAHLNTLLDTPYTTIISNFGKDNARLVAASAKEAIELISRNIHTYAIDCGFKETQAFLLANTGAQEKELEHIREACVKVAVPTVPAYTIEVSLPFTHALEVPGQAKFHPLKYLHGIANAYENAGGVILQQCRMNGIIDNEIKIIETDKGPFKARAVIYATHIPTGVNLLHLRCMPYRSYAMAFTLRDQHYPQNLYYDMEDPYHYYRTQEIDGQSYLIAGGKDHRTGQEENTEKHFIELEAHVRHYFDIDKVAYKWSSQYYEPVDGLPYIGQLPGHPDNIYVATGFGGNGMTYSSVAATILSDILLGHSREYTHLYDPNRIKPVAGFTNFLKHNADVAGVLLSQLFNKEKLESMAQLAPGESKVVKWEDHTIALHKDEHGALHALNSKCTHMGCQVAWNAAEQSWDCPCHGARYSYDGTVLNAPADKGLEKVDLSKS